MSSFQEHLEQVNQRIQSIKPPSKLLIVFSSLLLFFSISGIILSILLLIISFFVWVFQLDASIVFSISKYMFVFSLGGIIIGIVLFRSYLKKNKEFRNTTVLREDFKIKILPTFIQQKYPDLRYYFDGMVNENYINDSGFFTKPVINLKENWFLGDDYFIGKLNNVELEFCELYYKSTGLTVGGWAVLFLSIKAIFSLGINGGLLTDLTDLFGSDETSQAPQKQQKDKYDNNPFLYGTKTNFRGFFLYADFHKDFDATVKIKSKKMIRRSFLNFNTNLHKIRVENALVNKKYDVFTDNTQLAYYVLSPSIIDAIENVNKKLGTNLNMTLKNGKLFLMIPYNKDFFENISIEKDRIIAKSETDIQDELNVISQLITELNISNRIWSKV